MKSVNRINQKASCIIPRNAITGLMLVMATFTIFFFVYIEVKRIMWLKNIGKKFTPSLDQQATELLNGTFLNISSTASVAQDATPLLVEDYSSDIFSGNPLCHNRLFLVVLAVSAPENFERRDAIRKSWQKTDLKNRWISGMTTKVIFLIGRSSNRFLNVLLKHENEASEDLLMGEYLDTYRNLTLKVVHGLTWVATHCQPSYVLKTDDDCFVNLPLLLDFLHKSNPIRNHLYAGRVRWSAPVVRDPNSRWYVSKGDFKAARFPPYVSGAGYVLSLDVLKLFAELSSIIPIFPNEDAYVGTVLNRAGERPTYSGRFVTNSGTWQTCNFLYLFVVHHVNPARQREYRDMAKKAFEQCPRDDMSVDWV